MKTLYKYILITLIALPFYAKAQCDLPLPFTGNTGSNMTVFFTSSAIDALPLNSDAPYIVAFSPDGLIVGSASVASSDLIGGQQSLAVWADDTATPETDGAIAGQPISFQLVDGNSLYDLDLSFAGPNLFTANGQLPVIASSAELNCTDSDSDSDSYSSCDLPSKYEDNTGSNMTLFIGPPALNSLPITNSNAYLVAYSSSGLIVGSSDVSETVQGSLAVAIWGDDTFTSEIDGATDGESVSIQLVDGTSIYELEVEINFVVNNIVPIVTPISSSVFCEGDTAPIYGCTEVSACNFDPTANTDNGSCEYPEDYYDCDGNCLNDADGDDVCDELEIVGCQDLSADNYNPSATDPASCQYLGCTDISACNYEAGRNVDDGSCEYPEEYYDCDGNCINDVDSDGVCDELEIVGCQELSADNYDSSATDPGFCIYYGCIDISGCNYDSGANTDNGSCQYPQDYYDCDGNCLNDSDGDGVCDELEIVGCQDPSGGNYNPLATDPGFCIYYGCIDISGCNYDSGANTDDGSCEYPEEYYDCDGNCLNDSDGDGVCDELEIVGCQDLSADNYDSLATDPGFCIYLGCTDILACNYVESANQDDGSCQYPQEYYDCNGNCLYDSDGDGVCDELEIVGCQDPSGGNYNPLATDSDFCIYFGCMDINADNFNPNANTPTPNSCIYYGCTDQSALNYDSNANLDDESCIYNVANYGCVLPENYSDVITGSNMNILITADFTSQIEIINDDAYIVGMTSSDIVVGSAPISKGQMTSITLWGDDQQTSEVDGALSWEEIRLFVVDGTNLYRILLLSDINYSDNQTSILNEFEELQTICLNGYYTQLPIYGCLDPIASNYIEPIGDASVDVNTDDGTCLYNNDFNCVFPLVYDGTVTGVNMNILFTEDFMNSLPSFHQGSYIVATNNSNTTFGSVDVFGTNINALTIWGDDTGTPNIDGAIQNEHIYLYLVNGYNVYNINPYDFILYENNSMLIFENTAAVSSVCSNGIIVNLEGCTDPSANNYNPSATNDDNSCLYDGCTYSEFYEFSDDATIDNGDCENLIVYGCTDSLYVEFNPLATENNGSCGYLVSRIRELELLEASYDSLLLLSSPITVDLYIGWNLIGYTLPLYQNTAACFDDISDKVHIVKSNWGYMYWPEFGFNGIGDLQPGQGYQVLMREEVNDFMFTNLDGLRIELNETVPEWVNDIPLIHPNDIKTLVKVLNSLGQEVNPENQNSGTVLLYLYNDGSVTKKIVP